MPLWRCKSIKCTEGEARGSDFEASTPVCPKCSLDATQTRYARHIHRLTTIHLEPLDGLVAGQGVGVTLCGGEPVGRLWTLRQEQASGHPDAVNCPACRGHEEFPKAFNEAAAVPGWTVGKQLKKMG